MSKVERMLKKEAKRVHEQILARSEDELQAFLAEQFPQNRVQPKAESSSKPHFRLSHRLAFAAASILIVITALVVALVKLLPNNNSGNNDPNIKPIEYHQSNEDTDYSTIVSLNDDMNFVSLILATDKSNVILTYDSPSGDRLYYRVAFDDYDKFESAIIYIAVNVNYRGAFDGPTEPIPTNVNGFSVQYNETIEFVEELGFYSFKSYAVIFTDKERIYVTYEAYSLDEDSNFLNWLEQTITAK